MFEFQHFKFNALIANHQIFNHLFFVELTLNSINTLIEAVCTETNDLTSRFDEEWIESSELSAILGVSIKTLNNYKKQGLIEYSIIGRKLFFKRSDVDKTLRPKLKKKIDNNGTDKKR